jgi:ABC-2 type transport system ATP-binding protein
MDINRTEVFFYEHNSFFDNVYLRNVRRQQSGKKGGGIMSAIIEVNNLVKQYNRAKSPAVDGIDFSVQEGEFFAFLGPNGAGKTTTISILTTTLSKTGGEVRIAGLDVAKQAKEVREKVGIIFQQPSLDPQLSAEENIRFHACLYGVYGYRPTFKMMPKAYKDRVMELAEIVGIADAMFKPIKKLSGGMQRKLEIIRSLIHTPKILFLDEPTQGLDAVSRRSLWDYLNGVRRENGTTVFLTTHYIDEAEGVDKVCIINHGKIAACCSPEELKKTLEYDPTPKVCLPTLEDAYIEYLNKTKGDNE